MRVVVVWDVAHVVIHVMLEGEVLCDNGSQAFVHVFENCIFGFRSVFTPNNHRHCANFALCNPANIIFMKPLSDSRRLAEIAVVRRRHPTHDINQCAGLGQHAIAQQRRPLRQDLHHLEGAAQARSPQ